MGQTIIFVGCAVCLVAYVIYKIGRRSGQAQSKNAVSQAAEGNEPLDTPCTIHIKVNNNVATQIGGPWRYGFSLNGQAPQFTVLGGELELTTSVKHNALLGYGRGTYGGYKKPNIETPFRFDAESGGTVRLVADAQFSYQNDANWKSNLSFEEPESSGKAE